MKPVFRQIHFVGVDSSNHFTFGLASGEDLLIALNTGPGEFVIHDSIFVDDRFVRDSNYLLDLLKECIHYWVFDEDYLKKCLWGKIWVNPDLKNLTFV